MDNSSPAAFLVPVLPGGMRDIQRPVINLYHGKNVVGRKDISGPTESMALKDNNTACQDASCHAKNTAEMSAPVGSEAEMRSPASCIHREKIPSEKMKHSIEPDTGNGGTSGRDWRRFISRLHMEFTVDNGGNGKNSLRLKAVSGVVFSTIVHV